jgi:hypothetical protein
MSKRKNKTHKDDAWAEAKRRCRLSAEHVRRAKEMGLNPKSLIKNIPSPKERWKLPVREWIDAMYEASAGKKPVHRSDSPRFDEILTGPAVERSDLVADLTGLDIPLDDVFIDELMAELERENEPPDEAEIEEQRQWLLLQQKRFRQAAEWVARKLSALPSVRKIVLCGSVANPLAEEIPRFQRFRRWRIALPHECHDVDLAVWLDDFSHLKSIQTTKRLALDALAKTEDFHVAPHQVDTFLFNATDNAYAGRLCHFATCPKGKRECDDDLCGRVPYLKHMKGFAMLPKALSPERSLVLFDSNPI